MRLFYKMLKELFDHQKKGYKVHKTKKNNCCCRILNGLLELL